MCDCLKQNIQGAVELLQQTHGDKLQVSTTGAFLVNQGALIVGNTLKAVGYDEISVVVQPKKRDGSLGNHKKRRVPVIHAFCPHCGEKYAP